MNVFKDRFYVVRQVEQIGLEDLRGTDGDQIKFYLT